MSGLFVSETGMPSASLAALLVTASLAAYYDWRSWRIPNTLVAGSMAAAVMLAVFSLEGMGTVACLLGGLAGFTVFMPLYLAGGVGAGDVKLMGSLGMHAGWLMTLEIAVVSALVGGLWAVTSIVQRSETVAWLRLKCRLLLGLALHEKKTSAIPRREPPIMKSGSAGTLPYAVVIAIGTGLVIASRFMA